MRKIVNWTFAAPFLAWILILINQLGAADMYYWFAFAFLVACVMASVHHAEIKD